MTSLLFVVVDVVEEECWRRNYLLKHFAVGVESAVVVVVVGVVADSIRWIAVV